MIQLKDIEDIQRELPERTHLFLRCLELKYAKAFIEKGSMKFSNPSDWCKPDKTSRGDILEGSYASQRGFNAEMDRFLRGLRNNPVVVKKKGFTFYQSKDVMSYRAHCLYGLHNNSVHMQEQRSQDHQYHLGGQITKEYFRKLFPDVKEREIDSLEPKDRPAVLFIRPDDFVNFVTTKLMERGVKEDEIIIWPVSYMDYFYKPFIIGSEPEELFSKHISYSEQSEVRIVINTRRKEVSDLFDQHGVIELGPIDESIATLSEFYFNDMVFEIRGNQMLYGLAKPQTYKLDELSDDYFISVFFQALADELPEAPMSIETMEKWMDDIFQVLKKRDPQANYDRGNNCLIFKGSVYNIGARAGYKLLEHYNTYILSGDIKSAGETVAKFKHFFPMYNMGNYFSAYYKAVNENK